MTIAAVVLAAGPGSRFAGSEHKLLTRFQARPLVVWAVEAACGAGLDETVVVVGSHDDEVTSALPPGVTVVVNPRWPSGIASSLAAAVEHCRAVGHEAAVIGLGDQPFITAEAWRRVAAFADRPIGVATYGGERRNPVKLASEVWPLVPDEGEEGMRAVMRLRPELVGEVPCPGQGVDIDTVEDLNRWS